MMAVPSTAAALRVAILYDEAASDPAAAPDISDVLTAVEAVQVALRDLGHTPIRLGVAGAPERWAARLADAEVDVVFNLCEGVGGAGAGEARVAAVVELMGLPLTGCGSELLGLARRKDRVNAILVSAVLPVPDWTLVHSGAAAPAWSRYPAIVKPAGEDASVGITQRSVVRDRAELAAALEAAARHGPLLVQEFVAGRELYCGVVGERMLPLTEIDFGALPPDHWPLVTYEAKWEPGSAADLGTTPVCPARLAPEVARTVAAAGLAAWRTLEGRGYGRVDLRLDDEGRPWILEVNPNPDLSPAAGLARMAAAGGWGYRELVAAILREARP
jgi:D-alanine-D-alanine ligase